MRLSAIHTTPKTAARQRGFTLMELMLGLGIILLLVGVGMYAGKFWSEEQMLHKPMDEMKIMAKKAQHRAISEQRDWEIVIRPSSLELRPKQAANEADQEFLDAADKKLERRPGVESVSFAEDIRLAVRRFGEDKFQVPRPDYWVFQHTGICEPILFRVERGERFVEVQFDPLTAGVMRQDAD